MKSMHIVFTFMLSILLLLQACDERKVSQAEGEGDSQKGSAEKALPHKTWVNPDSLIIRIPGRDGMKQPEKISSKLPPSFEFEVIYECTPGISFLPQTIEEKLAGVLPVKSKKPEVIRISQSHNKKLLNQQFKPPIITTLSQPLNINHDSISTYKKIASERGLVTIQHGDSIFPAPSFIAKMPEQIKALPLRYKDLARFDIRCLDSDQYLPNTFIRAIIKDSRGIIWFGTHTGGLVSYDGQFFDHYTTKTGLSSNAVISLIEDKKHNLWIGTQGGGVVCFDGKRIIQYTTKQGLPSDNINAINEDKNGNIWFATTKGVSSFDGKVISTYTTDHGLAMNNISTLFEDNLGNMWFGTLGKGVTKFDGKSFITFTKKDGLASNNILSIIQDNLGNLWFGTQGGGVSKFDGKAFTNYSIEQGLGNDIILSIAEDIDNNIWFGTHGNGITRFNGKAFSHYTENEGLSSDYIRVLFDDGQGNLWIGTDGEGVSLFNLHGFKHYTQEQGLSNTSVLSLFQDNNNKLWFGTFEGGVLIYEESDDPNQKGTFTNINTDHGLPYNIVSSIIMDNNNNFWFGTFGGGVSKLDGESLESGELKFTNYSTDQGLNSSLVSSVLQDNKGNIWFGTDGGATKFDGNEFVTITEKNGLGSNIVTCVFQDQSENLWFGTIKGGVSLFKDDTLFQYTTKQGLGNNTVWTIKQDHNGIMWFGTDGGGLTYFNGDSFSTISREDGLSNNHVFSLVIDDDNYLWIGTTKGLNQFKLPDTSAFEKESFMKIKPVIINYGKMDGLKGLDFLTNAVFHDNKNRLWWGTTKALTMLELKNYKSPIGAPIVHTHRLTINNKSINFNKLKSNNKNNSLTGIRFSDVSPFSNNPIGLSLPYNLNHITFHFSAIDWAATNQIQYQYKLQGLDQGWSLITNNNFADYGNISSGHYTFQLRASGKTGNWSSTLEYPFTIRSPWWLNGWVILLYIIVLGFIIWLFIRWRVSLVLKQKIVLENLIFDRTKELDSARKQAEQATITKSQFIATISHEIRTPLNAIIGLTNLAINNTLNHKQEDYLQKIDRSAVTLLNLLNDILDFSKIEAGKMQLEEVNFDLEIVLNSIIILNLQNARDKNLEFVITINPLVPRMLIGDPLRLGQVITNLCSNAIKFTSSGEIVIHVDISKKISKKEIYLQISVKDSGIGISKEQIPYLFDEFKQADSSITRKYGGTGLGLTISKSILDMMAGSIWLETELEKGTTFFFNCKVGVQHQKSPQTIIIPDKLKRLNILVCIGHPETLNSLVTILQSYSLNADSVASGKEAFKQLEKRSYDLLIIDLHLSGMSGVDTIILIRENKDVLPKKIILIAYSDKNQQRFEKIVSGIDGYLSKPFLPSVVLEEIMVVFGMEKVSSPLRHEKEIYLSKIKKAISGYKVLLADDNEISRQVIFELVDNVGVKVDLAENGTVALQKTLETHYDLILMDLHMPVMDGYDSSSQIRKNNILTPIIAITADIIDTVAAKCNEAGINDIIFKPIDPDLLYDKLLKWMSAEVKTKRATFKPGHDIDNQLLKMSIPNLDMLSGVRRFGDNEKLYIKMLNKFVSSNEQTCMKIRELVRTEKFEQAHLMIHTLKGESGNVGADKVAKLSQQVEKAVLNKDLPVFDKKMILLEKSLTDIFKALQKNFREKKSQAEKDVRSIKEIIPELTEYLKLNNPKAFDLLDELADSSIPKSDLNAIIKAVKSENLKEAIVLLEKLTEED